MSIDLRTKVRAIRCPKMTMMQKCVLLELADRTNSKTGLCNPSQQLLADDLSASIKGVHKAIKQLKDLGYITAYPSNVAGQLHYKINFDKLPVDKADKVIHTIPTVEVSIPTREVTDLVCSLPSRYTLPTVEVYPTYPVGTPTYQVGTNHNINNINNTTNTGSTNSLGVSLSDNSGGGVLLEKNGISSKKAKLLEAQYDVKRIKQVITEFGRLNATSPTPLSAGWIVKALEDDFILPENAPNLSNLPISKRHPCEALVEAENRQNRLNDPDFRKRQQDYWRDIKKSFKSLKNDGKITHEVINELRRFRDELHCPDKYPNTPLSLPCPAPGG